MQNSLDRARERAADVSRELAVRANCGAVSNLLEAELIELNMVRAAQVDKADVAVSEAKLVTP